MAKHPVTVKNFAYTPKDIEVTAGDTVVWTSEDSVAHTVTADAGEFDSGDIAKGDPPFEHTFKSAGEVKYHCDHHGGMKGKVTVKASKPDPKRK
jgi:plastocyanin